MSAAAPATGTRDVYIEANGLRHHLLVRGEPGSPVVVMVHGLAQQAHAFDAIATHLAARYHVYCLDVRGRGESAWGPAEGYSVDTYVADLESVLDGLGIRSASLIGTSMGGQISMYFASGHPGRVNKLVLNDIGPEIDPAGLQRIVSYVGDAPDGFPDAKAVVKYYRTYYAPMVSNLNDDQVWEVARWNVRKTDTGMLTWKMDPMIRRFQGPQPEVQPWDAYNAITCPVLVLRGADSDILSPETAVKMAAKQGATLVEVPGIGHAPSLGEPEAVSALEAFLTN